MSAAPDLMQAVINEVATLVSRIAGIQLGPQQHPMIQRRIHSRMLKLGLDDPAQYTQYLHANLARESEELVSLLTTHHTFFFREQVHFDYLESILPDLIARARKRADRTIRIWSAASSTGQEAYSIAMFLDLHLSKLASDVQFEIFGTDVDPASVATATNGVFQKRELNKVPLMYLNHHWAKGHGEIADFVKAKDSLRKRVRFQPMNLLADTRLQHVKKFDVIFCRNVFIYFNEKQISNCMEYLLTQLDADGRIFLGVSESMVRANNSVEAYGNSIFGHKQGAKPESKPALGAVAKPVDSKSPAKYPVQSAMKPELVKPVAAAPLSMPTATAVPKRPLRVLCVDDSKSILGLLSKILTPAEGFEIVATAENGVEAAAQLQKHPIDVVTLDIHMPELDGVNYLARHYSAKHPPVVMISSVSREDAGLAVRALQLGATDYVEKPSLAGFQEAADEIRSKLRSAVRHAQAQAASNADGFDAAFAKTSSIKDPKGKLLIIVSPVNATKQISSVLQKLEGRLPPVVVVVDGAAAVVDEFTRHMQIPTAFGRASYAAGAMMQPQTVYTVAGSEVLQQLARQTTDTKGMVDKTCVLVFGQVSKPVSEALLLFRSCYLVLEDLQDSAGAGHKRLAGKANETVPQTTFAYAALRYLGDK